jgi:ribonuclease BN (tRNA processing enzyme)
VRLAVLGSGTALPTLTRGASGYACIADDGSAFLLECGPGSTRRWPQHGITFASACAVLVTHHHVDHVCDLPAVLFARNVIEPPVATPLVLAGPIGHLAHLTALRALHGNAIADPRGLVRDVELVEGDQFAVGPFRIEARAVRHVPGAIGVRVEADGRVLAFSGDSGPCDALVALCRGVDLALLECSYPASRSSRGHLTTQTAAETASAAGVERLVLTHFYPQCDAADREAEVRAAGYREWLHLAADGDEIPV